MQFTNTSCCVFETELNFPIEFKRNRSRPKHTEQFASRQLRGNYRPVHHLNCLKDADACIVILIPRVSDLASVILVFSAKCYVLMGLNYVYKVGPN